VIDPSLLEPQSGDRFVLTPLASECPTCGAPPNADCVGVNGGPVLAHADRAEGRLDWWLV
jgi:hypothetical protein